MKTIWKFPIEETDKQTIEMPKGAKILTIKVVNTEPCIYAIVDPEEKEKEKREIITFGTGQEFKEIPSHQINYIGTYQFSFRPLVFHVCENIVI